MKIESLSQIKKRGTGGITATTTSAIKCQKCLQTGHRIHECRNQPAPYVKRPTRTQQLKNPIKLNRERKKEIVKLEEPEGLADKILAESEETRRNNQASKPTVIL